MKKLFSLITAVMMIVSVMPVVLGVDIGTGIGIDITTEEFEPLIWMCDNRVVVDDQLEDGRIDGDIVVAQKVELCAEGVNTEEWCNTQCAQFSDSGCVETCLRADSTFDKEHGSAQYCPILKGLTLNERIENYAFEGEKIEWKVLVMDKNKIEQIKEVVATVDETEQGVGGKIEVECVRLNSFASTGDKLLPSCNARISEEQLKTFDDQTMAYYECTLTVEPTESMYGEHWITVEAISKDGKATINENEFWFLNPTIALSVDGDLEFEDVRPGTVSYSDTLLVGNDADVGSGVLLDMFISGTDFYDSDDSGARCVITNRLKLGDNTVAAGKSSKKNTCQIGFDDGNDHLCYYATSGAYGTQNDARSDVEGYAPIVYGNTFTEDFYNDAEIIQNGLLAGGYSAGNVLTPGAEIAMTFKLGLPEPCVGDFNSGSLFFWGEAI